MVHGLENIEKAHILKFRDTKITLKKRAIVSHQTIVVLVVIGASHRRRWNDLVLKISSVKSSFYRVVFLPEEKISQQCGHIVREISHSSHIFVFIYHFDKATNWVPSNHCCVSSVQYFSRKTTKWSCSEKLQLQTLLFFVNFALRLNINVACNCFRK